MSNIEQIKLGKEIMPNKCHEEEGVSYGGLIVRHLKNIPQTYSFIPKHESCEEVILKGMPLHIVDEKVLGISKNDKEINAICYQNNHSGDNQITVINLDYDYKSILMISSDLILTHIRDISVGNYLVMDLEHPGFYRKLEPTDKGRKPIFRYSYSFAPDFCEIDSWSRVDVVWRNGIMANIMNYFTGK